VEVKILLSILGVVGVGIAIICGRFMNHFVAGFGIVIGEVVGGYH